MDGKYFKRYFLTFVSSITCLLKSAHNPIRRSSLSFSIPTAIAQITSLLRQYSSSSFPVLPKNLLNKG